MSLDFWFIHGPMIDGLIGAQLVSMWEDVWMGLCDGMCEDV